MKLVVKEQLLHDQRFNTNHKIWN